MIKWRRRKNNYNLKDKKFRNLLLRLLGIRKNRFSGSLVALLGEEKEIIHFTLKDEKVDFIKVFIFPNHRRGLTGGQYRKADQERRPPAKIATGSASTLKGTWRKDWNSIYLLSREAAYTTIYDIYYMWYLRSYTRSKHSNQTPKNIFIISQSRIMIAINLRR